MIIRLRKIHLFAFLTLLCGVLFLLAVRADPAKQALRAAPENMCCRKKPCERISPI